MSAMELESSINETVHDMTEGTLPHQTWSQTSGSWTQRRSPPQPTLTVAITTNRADYRAHGHTLREEGSNQSAEALADTGCQSCLAGPQLMRCLGLEKRDLIPTSLTMRSASGNQLPIIGAALMRIRLTQSGRETRHISPKATKLYLSLSTCTDLGLIQDDFPRGQSTASIQDKQAEGTTEPSLPAEPPERSQPEKEPATARPCHCPDRAPPPQRPTTLPYPATEENREKLEKYLLETYSSSTFNICEHQTLPMMSGPPLALHIDPTATPKPCHTPIPIPIHWQEEVKRGLDRDVRLGVPGHTSHLVPPNGGMHQEERVTQEDHKFPTPEQACHARDAPLSVPLPPGQSQLTWNQEDHLRRVERLPLCTTEGRR